MLAACGDSGGAGEAANLALVQGAYDAFAEGDVEGVTAVMADDIVWNEAENFPYADGNPYVGPDAVVEGVFARLGSEWDYWRLDVEDLLASGETVVARGRYQARHAETAAEINAQFVHFWTIEDGELARFQQYADTAQVQAAMPDGAAGDE
ncbi:ketosteroid isomerase [Marinicauda salina]|uniref:Ketosteroid isomerase n=2 Tax=Marinicauda salina TaxID=2135793 RepID=A0A2U2BSA7_9PROT|nr:ketosteroid isomerase [Marinicauda salina]